MTVRAYASTDDSHPVLTGTAGSLNALLLACLVNGYGSKPGAGWTAPYSNPATQEQVFLVAGANPAYLRIQDNGQSAGGLREARFFGYETMSAYNSGTGLFPSAAQRANGYCVRKSASADSTERAWWLLADESRLYLFIINGDVSGQCSLAMFGKFKSYKLNDPYNFQISGRLYENSISYSSSNEATSFRYAAINTTGSLYFMRSYTGIGGATVGGMTTDTAKTATSSSIFAGAGSLIYPNPADGGLYLAKTYLNEANVLRGELPGLWTPLHSRPINHLDTFTGVEGLTGRDFLCLWTAAGGCLFLETSDTWDV